MENRKKQAFNRHFVDLMKYKDLHPYFTNIFERQTNMSLERLHNKGKFREYWYLFIGNLHTCEGGYDLLIQALFIAQHYTMDKTLLKHIYPEVISDEYMASLSTDTMHKLNVSSSIQPTISVPVPSPIIAAPLPSKSIPVLTFEAWKDEPIIRFLYSFIYDHDPNIETDKEHDDIIRKHEDLRRDLEDCLNKQDKIKLFIKNWINDGFSIEGVPYDVGGARFLKNEIIGNIKVNSFLKYLEGVNDTVKKGFETLLSGQKKRQIDRNLKDFQINVEKNEEKSELREHLTTALKDYRINVDELVKILAKNDITELRDLTMYKNIEAWKTIEGLQSKQLVALNFVFSDQK